MFLIVKNPLDFFWRGAVFDRCSRSSIKNRFEFLRHDFLFYSFGVVRVKKFYFSFSSGIYSCLPRSNLATWLKLGLNFILSLWCLTIFPSMSLMDAAQRLDFLKKLDFSPGLLIKSMLSALLWIELRRILFLLLSWVLVRTKCSESLIGSVFLISYSSASSSSSY